MSKTESITPADVLTDVLKDGPRNMPSVERAQEMLDIDMKYAACFYNRDFDGMEKLLVDSPDFEMQPLGLRIQGMKAYKERSRRLQRPILGQLNPHSGAANQVFRSLAFGKDVMIIEWSADHTLPDGSRKRCYTIAVIQYAGDKIVGERVYTCENAAELRRHALGPDFLSVEGVSQL